MSDLKPPPGYARIYLDIPFTRHRWKTQLMFTGISIAITLLLTIAVIGYATTCETLSFNTMMWPATTVIMSICVNLTAWAHCITLRGFVDITTETNTHE